MIPKIIHYCWFGDNPKPPLVLRCIESWKKFCPDYRIIEWNESNFDIHCNAFVEEAYHAKKWAFVSDYARAKVLFEFGGVYLDTDMEIVGSLEPLLVHSFFAGFEVRDTIATGIIGCTKECDTLHSFIEYYQNKHFMTDNKDTVKTSPTVISEILKTRGVKLNGRKQCVSGGMIYPKPFFCQTGLRWIFGRYGRKTVAVHHYMDSWGKNTEMLERSIRSKVRVSLVCAARSLLGTETMNRLGKRIRARRRSAESRNNN